MGRHASGDASLNNGQEEGHALGDACYGPCLVMGTSWSRDPLGFQHSALFWRFAAARLPANTTAVPSAPSRRVGPNFGTVGAMMPLKLIWLVHGGFWAK